MLGNLAAFDDPCTDFIVLGSKNPSGFKHVALLLRCELCSIEFVVHSLLLHLFDLLFHSVYNLLWIQTFGVGDTWLQRDLLVGNIQLV